MKIHNAVALVTGANRGIGLAFARELAGTRRAQGVCGARDPSTATLPGVVPVRLDVTKPDEVGRGRGASGDVTLVINNAGVGQFGGFLDPDSEDVARRQLETNFFGMLRVSKAFAPVLKANGGGALAQRAVDRVVGERRHARRVRRDASRRPGRSPIRCATSSHARDASACAAHGLRRHRSRARDRRAEGEPEDIVKRALDGLEAGSTKCSPTSAPAREAGAVGRCRQLSAAARLTPTEPSMTSASAITVDARLPKTSPWPVFWISSVAAFLVSLDTTMLYSAFGALRAGFPEATAADMSWVLNAYTVVYAAMLIPAGGLADTHGASGCSSSASRCSSRRPRPAGWPAASDG
jgi:hypothetical protein